MVPSLRRYGIQLVKEYDARTCIPRALEHPTDVRFRLSDVHIQKFWTLDGEEVEGAGCGNSFGNQCLPSSRRTIEQDA